MRAADDVVNSEDPLIAISFRAYRSRRRLEPFGQV
jgi:hypothetical protein